MLSLFKSDFFRHFLGGFAIATVALIATQPAEQKAEWKAQVHAAVSGLV